ncbi:hypothetical protein MUK42_21914, partial [Musa troglodytarum]
PISLLSHAQKRIHIGNNGIPLLHSDARSPSLLPRHDCSVYQYSTPRIKIATAIFVRHERTKLIARSHAKLPATPRRRSSTF